MTQQAHLVQSKILAFLNTNQKGFEMKEINNLTQLLNTLDFGKTFHQVSLSENKYIFQETPLGDTFTIGYETGAESVNFFIPTTIPKPIFFDFHQTFKIRQYENNIHKIYPYYFWPQFHKSYVHFTNQLSESKKIDQNDPKMQIIQSEQISKEVPNLHENSFVEFKGFTKNPVIITDVISKIVEYAVSFLNYSALNNNTKIPGSIYIGVEETKNISRKPKNVYFAEKPNDLEEIFVDVSDLSIHLDPFIKNPKIQFHLRKKVQTKLANPQSIAESFWENNIQLLAFIWDDEEPDIQQPVYGLPISSQEKDDFLGYLKKLFFNGRCTVKVCQNKKIYRNYKPLSNNEFTQIIQVLKQNAKSKSVLVSKNKQMLIIENEKETDNFIKKRFIFWPTIPLANIKPFYQKIGDRYLFQFQFKPDLLFHFFGYPEIYLQEYHLNDRNRNYFEIMAKYFPQSFPNFAFIKKPDLKLPESIKMMIEEIDFQRNNFIYIYGPKNSGKTIVGQLVANKIREKYPQFIFHYFNCGDFSNINDIQRVFVAHLTHEYDYLGEKYSSEEIQEKFESLFSPNFPHLLFFDDFPEEGEFSNWNKLYRDLNFPQNIIVIGTSFIQDSIFENIYEIDLITATEQITEFYERHPFWLQVARSVIVEDLSKSIVLKKSPRLIQIGNENQNQKQKQNENENQIENQNQKQKQNEIENQIEKQNQIGNENQNQNENQIENQKQNQIENEKENQIENQNENEKENQIEKENQNQNQNQIKNQIKNENQNQNQIGNEKENQNENQNQNQIGNEKENKNQNQNEEMDSLRKSMIEIRKSDGSIINRKIAIGIFNKMFAKEQQKWVILLYFFSEKFCAPFFRKYFAQNLEKIEQFEKSFILIKKNYLYFLHTRIKRFFAKNWMIFVRDPEIKEIIQESKKIFLDYYQKYSFIFRVLDPYQYTDYCNEEQNFKNAIEIEKEFKAKPIIESNIFGFSSYSNEKFMLLFGNLNPKHQVQKMVQLANFYSDLGKMDLSQILLQNVDKIVSNSVNERDQFDLLLEKSGLLIKQMKFDESLNLSEKLYSQAINLKMEQKITNFLLKNISICYSKKFLFNESMKFLKMMHKDELGFSDFIQFCNKQAINFMNQMKFDKSQKYLEMAQNSIELTQNFPKDYLVDQYNFHDEITNIFGKETAQMVISFIQKKMFQIKKSLLSFQTLENQGILNCLLGNYEKAYDLFSLQHGNYFARTDKFLVAKSLNYLAHTSYLLGNLSQSLSYHQRSLKMYVELKKDYSIMEHCVFSLVIFQKLGLSSSSEFEYNYSKFQELRPKYEKDEKYSSLINIFEVFFCKTPITLSRKLELITETLEKMKKRGLTYIIVSRFHLKLLIKLEISNPESDLDDLLKKVRNSQNNLAPLLQGYCNILFEIAKIYFKKKDYDLAHSIHMNVLHHRKDFRKGLYLLAKSYQKVAEVYQILNKKDEAIFHYKNALNCYENSPQIYHGEKIPISLKKIEKLNEILNSIQLN